MAETGSLDCPCSNISIMQLFHELKQRYPSVPDQIVSKVIQENCHDKNACAKILEKENGSLLQAYPGAIISGGNAKEKPERKTVCSCCGTFKGSSEGCSPRKSNQVSESTKKEKVESAFYFSDEDCIYLRNKLKKRETDVQDRGQDPDQDQGPTLKENKREDLSHEEQRERVRDFRVSETCCQNDERCTVERNSWSNRVFKNLTEGLLAGGDSKAPPRDSFLHTDCDLMGDGSHWCHPEKGTGLSERKTDSGPTKTEGQENIRGKNWSVPGPLAAHGCSERSPVHNYQVAVQYCLEAGSPTAPERKRSFTTVNLNVRPPSSEPQPPIEIQSGRNLTYSSSVFDARNGVQSNFQIVIGPALLEKQTDRKNRLARELRREQDRLRHMQNEVKLMKAAIALKPSPHVLPKLKTEIERLRAECEKLTAAVDLYSDNQNVLPLGETDEEFYRNIYTGQRLQREGSWSCQLCTFRNHPLLTVCEECEMPRISLGSTDMDADPSLPNVLPNINTSFCTGGGTSTSGSLITAPLQDKSTFENTFMVILGGGIS